MHTVTAFVPEIFLRSKLPAWFDGKCAERGHMIEWLNVNKDMDQYKPRFNAVKNIITWQCRMPHSWTSSRGVNLLHIDNSLINQRHGCFVDAQGFFSKSNLAASHPDTRDTFYAPLDEAFAEKGLSFTAKQWFGWTPFQGGDPEGPVLVALQYRRDCNVNFEFPLAPRGDDKVKFTLEVVKKHLPADVSVIVRPHPRERELFTSTEGLPPNWAWSLDGTLAEILPKCSALVTVNSTCATEACLLGLPVAVLGTGTFTGSGAVNECHDDFSKLKNIRAFKAHHAAQRAYVTKVLSQHTLPYEFHTDLENAEVDLWLDRLQ